MRAVQLSHLEGTGSGVVFTLLTPVSVPRTSSLAEVEITEVPSLWTLARIALDKAYEMRGDYLLQQYGSSPGSLPSFLPTA